MIAQVMSRLSDKVKPWLLRKLSRLGDFKRPVEAWGRSRHVPLGILLASLVINILSLAFPLALLQVYDRVIPNVAMNTLVFLIIGVGIALFLEAMLKIARSYLGAWADARFEHITACEAFRKVLEMPLKIYQRAGSGGYLKRLNSLAMLRDFYAGQAIVAVADLPFVVILLAIIIYIGGWLVLVPVIILIIFAFLMLRQAEGLDGVLRERNQQDDRRFNFIIETLGNIHSVKSLAMEAQMMRRYERLQMSSSIVDYDMSMHNAKSASLMLVMSQVTLILVVALGSMMVITGNLTVGGLAACTLLSGRFLQPIGALIGVWVRLQSVNVARGELQEILDTESESSADLPSMPTFEGKIEFHDINFRFGDEDPIVFEHLNFTIKAKEMIGITGESLSGKSTLLWLILGILKPTRGKVLVDDQNIEDFHVNGLREQIAYLPQQGILFSGTILDNLVMFDDNADIEYAKKVADMIGLGALIERLPRGYDTPVADQAIEALPRGVNQRIAIARALVKKPAIVLFDEANTAIDMHGDEIIKRLIKHLKGRCTFVLVSHRPSLLAIADRVLVLKDGKMEQRQ